MLSTEFIRELTGPKLFYTIVESHHEKKASYPINKDPGQPCRNTELVGGKRENMVVSALSE